MGYILVGTIIGGIIWGVVVNKVIENKGYEDNWFWWGFFFGIFALIVALTKQSVNTTKVVIENSTLVKENMELLSSCILNNQVNISSPVHVSSWEIKKDADKLVLFVDFINVSQKIISAVMFSATGFNSFGDRVQVNSADLFDVIGQDLCIKPNECGKVYATLQDGAIRKVEVRVKKVCFFDGTILDDIPENWVDTNQKTLESIHIECAKKDNLESKYYTIIKEDYWQCTCGFVNTGDDCKQCKMKKENALEFTEENIDETYQKYLEEQECEKNRIVEQQKIEEKQAKKNKRIVIGIISIISFVIAIVILLNCIIIPNYKYNQAKEYSNNGEFQKSAIMYASLNGYKDSMEESLNCWNKILNRNTISTTRFLSLGLKENGTVIGTGYNFYGCDISSWSDIISVAAGFKHAVGLKSNMTVVATGENTNGQCDVSDWENIVDISVKSDHTVGLKADGTVVAVGWNQFGQCNVSDWTDIVAISAGIRHTVGLKADGTVVAVGDNENGECNVSEWRDIIAISAGGLYTVGLKADGTVVAVGCNDYDACNVSDWTDIIAISADGVTVGLKKDGTVVAAGDSEYGACDVSGWKDIVAIYTSDHHTIGLQSNGAVAFTGYNEYEVGSVSEWRDMKVPKKE